MTSETSNFDRLHNAGIIEGGKFSDSDKAVIAKLTNEEVDVLIKLRQKTGEVPAGKEHMRPNFGV